MPMGSLLAAAAAHLKPCEQSGGTGAVCGAETKAFVRPRRPLNAGCADARMERGEHGTVLWVEEVTWMVMC